MECHSCAVASERPLLGYLVFLETLIIAAMTAVKQSGKIKRDVLWNLIGQFAYLFGIWLLTFLTTRILGYEAQGILSKGLVAATVCMSFGSYYLRLQFAADTEEKFKSNDYVFARLFLLIVSMVICFVYSLVLHFTWFEVGCVILFYSFRALELFSDIHFGVMLRHQRLYVGGISLTVKAAVAVGVYCLVALLTRSLLFSLIAIVIVSATFVAIDIFLTKRVTGYIMNLKEFSWSRIGKLLVVCFPLFILLLCTNLLPSIPRIVFEQQYDTVTFGKYSSIANIAVLIQTAVSAIMMPLVPKISRLYKSGNTKGFLKFSAGVIAFALLLGGVASVMVLLLGNWALELLYGAEILEYASTFIWTIVAATSIALVAIGTSILGAMERRRLATIATLSGVAVCAAVSYPMIQACFMDGISFALIIAESVAFLVCIAFILLNCKKGVPTAVPEKTETGE